jgi:low molecular weight phosphotyrosine protein phosphatase
MSNTTPKKKVSILFVCLGNICRSPMAEGVFRSLTAFNTASAHPLISRIDSCGTGAYHAGDNPDPRTMSVLKAHGITDYKHAARKVRVPQDFEEFDYVLAMDGMNVQDPYYGGGKGFEVAFEQLERFGRGLLEVIEDEAGNKSG